VMASPPAALVPSEVRVAVSVISWPYFLPPGRVDRGPGELLGHEAAIAHRPQSAIAYHRSQVANRRSRPVPFECHHVLVRRATNADPTWSFYRKGTVSDTSVTVRPERLRFIVLEPLHRAVELSCVVVSLLVRPAPGVTMGCVPGRCGRAHPDMSSRRVDSSCWSGVVRWSGSQHRLPSAG